MAQNDQENEQQPVNPAANPAAAGVNTSLATGFNSTNPLSATIRAGQYETSPQVVQHNTFTVKELEVDGLKFKVDMDLLDDIEAFELIDRIENKGQIAAIVPLLKYMVGEKGVEEMKAHFKKKYGKFRVSKLMAVYEVIVANFDPKD